MRKCPKCGRYMNSYVKQCFGGAQLVYVCTCGYNTENDYKNVFWSDRTEPVKSKVN